ncbi:hypothetical protein TrVFT333_003465 [Trichoderma virens FT-333]|nr:hypothetical protein TrVFT333_003465 [Trichoderma virens FT-333]
MHPPAITSSACPGYYFVPPLALESKVHELDEEDWSKVLVINLSGVRFCQMEELRIMKD